MEFRCAAASAAREDQLVGTASTVRAFLLVENDGPWGVDALRDCRLPPQICDELARRAKQARVRPLLVRRHLRRHRDEGRLTVFAAYAHPDRPWLESTELAGPEELLDLDLDRLGRGESPGLSPTDDPLFCVCTHGRHDACCAERGRPVAAALTASHPERTWEISHIGGDRFAANVLVLPDGLYYGRVDAAAAPDLAAAHLAGRLDLDRLRGRSGYGFAVQAAEVALRRLLGETRTSAVDRVTVRRQGEDSEVVLAVAGTSYRIHVRTTPGSVRQQLTCRALRANAAPEHEVLGIETLAVRDA